VGGLQDLLYGKRSGEIEIWYPKTCSRGLPAVLAENARENLVTSGWNPAGTMLLADLTAQHPMTERSFELQVATQG